MRRRRNGLAASCEPCRQRKLRCDHGKAPCQRCRQRGLQSQCHYHPAPLTKAAGSFVQLVEDEVSSVECPSISTDPKDLSTQHGVTTHSLAAGHERQVALVESVLLELSQLPFLRSLIHQYYAVSKSNNIPAPLVLPAVESLFGLVNKSGEIAKHSLRPLAEAVIRSTARPIVVTEALSAQEFLAMHTGENLRLEYLGIIYSIAGRASEVMLPKQGQADDRLVYKLFRHSDTCLQLASEIAPAITDAIVWLSLENSVLCTVACGDDSETVERHLGNLSSHLFAMGYHRETISTANTPFFLAECRRWTFAKAYNMEILFSALRGRPPRVLMRYSDTKLPLDLADDDIVADALQREQACASLSADGWNTAGHYFTASFRRARGIALQIREEALEYEYRPMTLERLAELSGLSARCRRAWEDLPPHMRYTPSCWDLHLPPITCMTLLMIKVGFLQSDREIFRAMERIDPQATASSLIVAHESLTLITHLSDARGRSPYIRHEFSSVVLGYGLPCAIVLATASKKLSQPAGLNYTLPEGVTRSTIIRDLAVFVSQLDSMALSAESNAEACGQASRAISRTLDDLLNVPLMTAGLGSSTAARAANVADDDFQGADLDAMLDDFDLADWIKSIEGTSSSVDWYNF